MATKVRIDVSKLNTQTRKNKAIQCAKELELLVNSNAFKNEVLKTSDYWRQGESSKYKFYTNKQIFDLIMSGKEETSSESDNELDLYIDDYTTWRSVVGYMIPGKPTIYVNTRFFDTMSKKKVVSNFLHEYTHTLGFRHSGPNLRKSLPYRMNDIVDRIYDSVLRGVDIPAPESPKYKTVCWRNWRWLWLRKTCRKVRID